MLLPFKTTLYPLVENAWVLRAQLFCKLHVSFVLWNSHPPLNNLQSAADSLVYVAQGWHVVAQDEQLNCGINSKKS